MPEPIDCRIVEGDHAVIISRDTAIAALAAMKARKEAGYYTSLMCDDASFIDVNIRELERAASST